MIWIPAARHAGMASLTKLSAARWPGPRDGERREERKKFCMSIIRRAVFVGSRMIGLVVVLR